jgi:CheY-like chemotaxis protein
MAKILIVDDDETDRLGLAVLLEQAGYDVCLAAGGDAALEVYCAERIHLVLTDIVMPGRDGLSLISALRGLDPNACIIAISGKSRSQLEASMMFGAAKVLAKPIDRGTLLAAIDEVMGAST